MRKENQRVNRVGDAPKQLRPLKSIITRATQDTVHVVAATPSIPRLKRTGKNLRPKD